MATGFANIQSALTTYRIHPSNNDVASTAGKGSQASEELLTALLNRMHGSGSWVVSGFDYNTATGLTATFNAGEAVIEGHHVVATGTFTVALEDSATNHIWLTWSETSDRATALGIYNATSDAPPSTPYTKIATVTTSGGNVTGNTDLRDTTQPTEVAFDASPQLGGDLDTNGYDIVLKGDDGVFMEDAASSDHQASGAKVVLTAGENLVFGDVCYVKSDGKAWKADANAAEPAPRAWLVALGTINTNATGSFAAPGCFIRDDSWSWTVGGPVYLSDTAGAMTQTAPNHNRALGIATHADRMFFFPQVADRAARPIKTIWAPYKWSYVSPNWQDPTTWGILATGLLDAAAELAYFTAAIPSDFVELVSAEIIYGRFAGSGAITGITATTEYGAIGEATNNHSGSVSLTANPTNDRLASLDISSGLASLAAGDILGVTIDGDATHQIYAVGLLIRYY